jgi:hypothetical protein
MPGEFVAGVGYSNSFANFAHDMNGDGLQDAVIIGFPGDPYHWYQNPGSRRRHALEGTRDLVERLQRVAGIRRPERRRQFAS